MKRQFAAPKHLSDRAKALWAELVPERARSPGRLALLTAALEAMDRAEQARTGIAASSLVTTTKTTGAVHINPLLKVEREARGQFARLWADLGFGFDHAADGISPDRFLSATKANSGE